MVMVESATQLTNGNISIHPGHYPPRSRAESFVGCGLKVTLILNFFISVLYFDLRNLQHLGALFSKERPGSSECKNLPKFCW